jgi:hypothetical protein
VTSAGEKLYREQEGERGPSMLSVGAHPAFLRGAWDVARAVAVVALLGVLFGLG